MPRITRVLLPAVFVIALCGVATSSAFAVEDPYYKLAGARLKAGQTREVGLKQVGNQVLNSKTVGITITCTGIAVKAGGTIIGSDPGEPGTSAGVIEYSNCTVVGNGSKCDVTSVAGAKDKKIVTNALKDELEINGPEHKTGVKILDLFTPASENVFVRIKFEPETGGNCTFTETTVEGTVDVEILNSKKQPVAIGQNEAEEAFGFIKALPNGTEECKLKAGKLDKCTKSSLKAFGVASTLEGEAEAFLTGKDAGLKFGVFDK